jgi:hypothetical protein
MNNFLNILNDDVIINTKYINKTLKTLASDDFDDGSILYEMNEHGYRSPSLKNKKSYNILTLGCSWTMGVGVRNEFSWPVLTTKLLEQSTNKNISCFNYSMYGTSTSFVAKTLYKFTKTYFIPDMVLIMWPGFSRRDYIKSDGSFKKIGGFRLAEKNDLVWKNDDEDMAFLQLRNDFQDIMVFWEAYKLVETIGQLYNIKIFHSVAGYYYDIFMEYKSLWSTFVNSQTLFIPHMCHKNDGLGRDKKHPGESWHVNFSKEFHKFITNRDI